MFAGIFQINAQEKIVIGTPQEDIAHSLKMFQGKYYIVGTTRRDETSAKDYYVIQLRSNGSVEKRFSYGFLHHDVGSQIIVDEHGIFILGSAYDWGFSNVDMHLFKLNETGLPDWEQFYGTQYQDMGFNAIRTNDGGFALLGYSNSQIDGGDLYFVKTDNTGQLEWEKLFGPKYVDYGFSLVENDDEEFILAGTENGFYNPTQTDFVTHDADILIVKTNNLGNEIWYKTFGGNGHDWAKDIIVCPEGGYFICGSTQSFGEGSFDVFLMKIDENGDEIWMKTFGGSEYDYGEKLQIAADGNIYISGTSASYSTNLKPDHFIIKADKNGEKIWTKILGTDGSDYTSGLVATPDSGLVFTGWTNDGEFGKNDIIFYKLSKNGDIQIISSLSPNDSVTSVLVYPNPAKQQFVVDVISPTQEKLDFLLFDVNGKRVMRKRVNANSKTELRTWVKSGVYYYRLINDSEVVHVGKLIIQN